MFGTKWKLSRIVSFVFVSLALVLLAGSSFGTVALQSASATQDPLLLKWYDMSAPSSPIPGNPRDQHSFDVVHTTNIVRCNKTINGSTWTYLAYDSDEEGDLANLFYSNNLTGPWTVYPGDPIMTSTTGSVRTPDVVYTGGVFYMFLNNESTKDVEVWTGADGIHFAFNETVLTTSDDPWTNPFVWLNPNDGNWYLFWEDGSNSGGLWMIYARSSGSITGFASAADTLVSSSASTGLRHIACPTVMYRDGYYWLLCESEPVDDEPWEVCAFVSTSVTSGYAQCPDSPILTTAEDEACPRVFVGDNNVSCYLFTNQNSTNEGLPNSYWYQEERTVDPRYYLYLTLSVEPSQAAYTPGQSLTLDVTALNEASSYVNSTLTLSITGPGGYGYFDFDRINATVGFSDCSFSWIVPNVAGTYVAEVSLVPMQLTAYDCAWLQVRSG